MQKKEMITNEGELSIITTDRQIKEVSEVR